MNKLLLLREEDDVAIAVRRIAAGEVVAVDGTEVRARQDVPPGHKVAVRAVREGEAVHKYGQIIGFATSGIEAGEHVHTRNLGVRSVAREYEYSTAVPAVEFVPETERRAFQGFK